MISSALSYVLLSISFTLFQNILSHTFLSNFTMTDNHQELIAQFVETTHASPQDVRPKSVAGDEADFLLRLNNTLPIAPGTLSLQ